MEHEDLILDAMDQAKALALVFHGRHAALTDADECVGVAYFALVDAAKRFDPARPNPFWVYAKPRVQGALMDSLRGSTQLTGTRGRLAEIQMCPLRESDRVTVRRFSDTRALALAIRMLSPRSARIVRLYCERGERESPSMAAVLGYSQPLYSWWRRAAFAHLRKALGLRGVTKVSDML